MAMWICRSGSVLSKASAEKEAERAYSPSMRRLGECDVKIEHERPEAERQTHTSKHWPHSSRKAGLQCWRA